MLNTTQKWRWIDTGKLCHVAYEIDGDTTITLCRCIVQGGFIKHGKSDVMENPCPKCVEATVQSLLVKEEVRQVTVDRRMKRGRKTRRGRQQTERI